MFHLSHVFVLFYFSLSTVRKAIQKLFADKAWYDFLKYAGYYVHSN